VPANTVPADTVPADTVPATWYGTLDPCDPAQLAEYERCFYDAYARLAGNTLTRLIWDFDHPSQRLRTRIRTPTRSSTPGVTRPACSPGRWRST